MNLSCTCCTFGGSPVSPNPWGAPLRKPRKYPQTSLRHQQQPEPFAQETDGSMPSLSVRKFLEQKSSCSTEQEELSSHFIVRFGDSMLAAVGVSCSELTGEIPSVVLCYCSTSALLRCSADCGCKQMLILTLLPFCGLPQVCPFCHLVLTSPTAANHCELWMCLQCHQDPSSVSNKY